MSRSWAVLVAVVLGAALALTLVARAPRRAPAPPPAPPPPPVDTVSLVAAGDSLAPGRMAATLGHRLAVTLANHGGAPVRVALSGYEHAFAPRTLAPGEARTDTLLLDLPGEDFAWMLDGRPAAQLRVAGAHLAEGHR